MSHLQSNVTSGGLSQGCQQRRRARSTYMGSSRGSGDMLF